MRSNANDHIVELARSYNDDIYDENILELNPEELAGRISDTADKWLVVKIYDHNCPHCKAFKPIYVQQARNHSNNLGLAMIDEVNQNIDETLNRNRQIVYAQIDGNNYPSVRSKYGVVLYPAVMIFHNNSPIGDIMPNGFAENTDMFAKYISTTIRLEELKDQLADDEKQDYHGKYSNQNTDDGGPSDDVYNEFAFVSSQVQQDPFYEQYGDLRPSLQATIENGNQNDSGVSFDLEDDDEYFF